MKIIKYIKTKLFIFLLAIITLFFSGCCEKKKIIIPEPEIKTLTVYVPVIEPVYRKLVLTEPIPCDFNGTGFQPTVGLINCFFIQKELIEEAYDFNITKD